MAKAEARLGVDDAEALVAVRSVMEAGIQRTSDSSSTGRMTAAVLMFAACEAAIYLGCDVLGVDIEERKRVDDQYAKLVAELKRNESLGADERLPAWRHVTKLRHLRNGAVHQLVAPDAERLRGLTAHVEGFISTLVERCFGIALQEVVASACIEDLVVREKLMEAEHQLIRGKWTDAVMACNSAFDASESGWKSIAAHAQWLETTPGTSMRFGLELRDLLKPALTAVSDVADAVRALPFAVDPAEYVWFRSLARGISGLGSRQHWEFSEEEARRSLRFVTGWQYRFESFRATYNAEIGIRPPPMRATSREDGRPEICWAEVNASRRRSIDLSGKERQYVEVRLPIAFDAAAENHLHKYGSILTAQLRDRQLEAYFGYYDGLAFEHGQISAQDRSSVEQIVQSAWDQLERELEETEAAEAQSRSWKRDINRRLESVTARDGERVFERFRNGAPPSVPMTPAFRGFDRAELEGLAESDAESSVVADIGPYELRFDSRGSSTVIDGECVEVRARAAAAILERARNARILRELEDTQELDDIANEWR